MNKTQNLHNNKPKRKQIHNLVGRDLHSHGNQRYHHRLPWICAPPPPPLCGVVIHPHLHEDQELQPLFSLSREWNLKLLQYRLASWSVAEFLLFPSQRWAFSERQKRAFGSLSSLSKSQIWKGKALGWKPRVWFTLSSPPNWIESSSVDFDLEKAVRIRLKLSSIVVVVGLDCMSMRKLRWEDLNEGLLENFWKWVSGVRTFQITRLGIFYLGKKVVVFNYS